ncbi:MAG: DAK2 domain-containing protein [Aggregatilineales bacterium]
MAVVLNQHVVDGHLLKWLTAAGLAWLEHNHEHVNQLNVFPVPDGDTGKNMLQTMRSAYAEIAVMQEGHVGIVGAAIARGALLGAHGNSGVILSQLWHGFAEVLRGSEFFDAALFARAVVNAVEAAYRAVTTPVEGTILTVAREAADSAARAVEQNGVTDLSELLELMVSAARGALERTPEMLPVLKKAGVVDSGGQGLLYILEGMLRLTRGQDVMSMNGSVGLVHDRHVSDALEPADERGYGYDVQFLMRGEGMDVAAVRAAIDAMGWSALVVGSSQLIKVHVHVHDPGEPLSYAVRLGAALEDVVVEDMQAQYQRYIAKRAAAETAEAYEQDSVLVSADEIAVIPVVSGAGMCRLFTCDLRAARVINGGQTMNPSTQDFLDAIAALPNERVILLPNNKNVVMAAQQAAALAKGRSVRVVPSLTLPQGISAMVAYSNVSSAADLDSAVRTMTEALEFVTSCEITTATRDVEFDGLVVRRGQYIGLLNGALAAAGDDLTALALDLLRQAGAEERELITLYYGDGLSRDNAETLVEHLTTHFSAQDFEIVQGDQPLYPYIISLE